MLCIHNYVTCAFNSLITRLFTAVVKKFGVFTKSKIGSIGLTDLENFPHPLYITQLLRVVQIIPL